MLLLQSITKLLDARASMGFRTTLHKIRRHARIKGNNLADAASKLAVRNYDALPPGQTTRVEVGETAPRPNFWVMYTAKPPTQTTTPTTPNSCQVTHLPWWTIPETERLQMNAFTRPSQQLRIKVRQALLRNLHHASLYRRLIVANKETGARLHTVGRYIH